MQARISLISTLASDDQHENTTTFHVTGTLYEGDSSRAQEVEVTLDASGSISFVGTDLRRVEKVADCSLSEPLGRMPRHFNLPDGSRLEIEDLATLSAWEKSQGRKSGLHVVHLLESRWRWVAAAVLMLAAFVLIGYFWVLPIAAEHVAKRLPPEVGEMASGQARKVFVKFLAFEHSKLSRERQQAITRQFNEMAVAMQGGDFRYRLEFFNAPMPNAFALPDGLVCITDELIEKAEHDHEIFGVLAHEIVHVRERHGMRSVLQNSAVFLIWTLMTGDLTAVTNVGAALPTMLAESGYSRKFELEADEGAAAYMIQAGWGTKPLQDMLQRIDPEHSSLGGAEEAISTHPLTENRIRLLKEMEEAKQTE
jgi:Zn-dependent protease with chaperone function